MRSLTAAELLQLWERARGVSPTRRPAVLLEAVHAEDAARWPIGRRDALILDLQDYNFGSRLACLTNCPRCSEAIELEFQTDDIRTAPPDAEWLTMADGERELRFRLPNTEDLTVIAVLDNPAEARRELFARCLNGSGDVAELNDETLTLVGEKMGEADRQADVQLTLACPQCSHEWKAPFDIAAFFWGELKSRAEALLREVHELATAYGWGEDEVLKLSPARRAAYLEMVRA